MNIKNFRIKLKIDPICLAPHIHTNEKTTSKYPPIMLIPSSGIAIKFDIKNVKDIVLKFFIIIGNIVICAAIGTQITFEMLLPISCNPLHLIGVGHFLFPSTREKSATPACSYINPIYNLF